jgi:hypothetical protein
VNFDDEVGGGDVVERNWIFRRREYGGEAVADDAERYALFLLLISPSFVSLRDEFPPLFMVFCLDWDYPAI